ncbi:GDP-L-fucose synthase [Micromonospora haikouensis]|uniref:GDP-L-fucose synthase n=1 Tax=Micromonospora haikouensis TaxID=686309 RepID=A0A1C4XDH2_9ACTN|nr:NAD(P)-dependent oxidoreductase [Micromonospora haikouensis]SCF06447.1 GDP-L-fucose synthase [Micromonospora haikouensis]
MEGPWLGRHVLVTGGLGFLGSHFVEELLAQGAHVSATTRDTDPRRRVRLPNSGNLRIVQLNLLDDAVLRAFLRTAAPRFDAVFHCAGLEGNADFRKRNAAHILETNVLLTSHVLGAARDAEIPTISIAGSADVRHEPAARVDNHDGYALAKRFSEFQAGLHQKQYGMQILLPRYTDLYGPRDRFGRNAREIPELLTRVVSGGTVHVRGDGKDLRTFMYVTDAVRATLQLLGRGHRDVVTIGTAEAVSGLDLARLVFELLDAPERIVSVPAESAGTESRLPDVDVLGGVIDFRPRPLRQGLADTVRWFRAEQETAATGQAFAIGRA